MDSSQEKVKRLLSGGKSRECMPAYESNSDANIFNPKPIKHMVQISEKKSLDFVKVEPPSMEMDRPRSQLSLALSTRSDLGGLTQGDGFDRVSAYAMDTFTVIVYFPCFPHQEEMVEFAKVELPKSSNAADLVSAAKKQYMKDLKDIAQRNKKPEPSLEEKFPSNYVWQLWAAEDDGEVDDDVPVFKADSKVADRGIEAYAIQKVHKRSNEVSLPHQTYSNANFEVNDDDGLLDKSENAGCCRLL